MSPEAANPAPLQTHEAVELSRGAYRRLAGNARFRRLWISQFVSGVGDWLVIGFLLPLVTTLSGGSAFAVAGILIAKIIPALVFSSLVGVVVDRFDRRKTMIAADLIRAVLTLGLFFTNSLAIIYLVVLLMELASLFFFPSKNALIPYLVDEDDVTAANGLSYTTQQASMLVGLAASGAILAGFEGIVRGVLAANLPIVTGFVGLFAPALLGPRAGVFVNTVTFLVSAAAIAGIRVAARAPQDDRRFDIRLIGADVRESWRFLRDHSELRGFLITIGLAILGGGTIIPVGLVHVQQNLSGGGVPIFEQIEFLERLSAAPQTFMLLFLAVGMLSGALAVPKLADRISLQLVFLGGVAGFGLAMFGFASVSSYALAGVFAALAGTFIAAVTVAGNSYVIRTVADEIRGRVFTAMESLIRVALLLSMIVMAPVGDFAAGIIRRIVETRNLVPADLVITGSQVALQMASFIVMAAAVYAFRTLNWRGCREECADA
ncbi:MAG: MFS transporter [Coriobacteriia bacterium]|nr:MFS transporter [Coriobacteriia bacterium]